MKSRIGMILVAAVALLACSFSSNLATAPTVQVPPTPSEGGTQIPVNVRLPDVRLGESGSSCGPFAANLTNQSISGTLSVFPRAGANELRANASDGRYSGSAALLNASCQPTGQNYNLTATYGLDYSATLGSAGGARCIQTSKLVFTSLNLQGLPGPLNAVVEPLVTNAIPRLLTPHLDDLVVRRLNNGQLPASGAHCPGA